MKRVIISLFTLLSSLPLSAESYLIGGSGSDRIAIVDASTQSITWSHALEAGQECNSVVYTKGGEIAYSYKQGAKLIDTKGRVIFDYNDLNPNEELQSITEIENGYLLGVCGNPARIVELNHRGKVIREISIDLQIEKPHSQFRQIRKSDSGGYIIPLMSRGSIIEVDATGSTIKEFALAGTPFSLCITKSGRWVSACGHSGVIYSIDPESGEIEVLLNNEMLKKEAITIEFGAEVTELSNGNLLLANWLGHKGDLSQPILIEITPSAEVVWRVENIFEELKFISAVREVE